MATKAADIGTIDGAPDLRAHGITVTRIKRNPPVRELYDDALSRGEAGAVRAANGALVAFSGAKTGRSPSDRHVVRDPATEGDIWWGSVNLPIERDAFQRNRARARAFLNQQDQLYVIDGFAGWDPAHRLSVRIICNRPYHALFMHNMLIRPTPAELADFGEPDFVVYNAGEEAADPAEDGVTSTTSVDLSFGGHEACILGTEYAGEMKKGVFTVMNYLMPKRGVLSMHCSATADPRTGSSSLLFGLSGTGKTTLSADPNRLLIGDDEHCWTDSGVFNIEGGCYAKTIDLSEEKEPDIYRALRYGAVLENVVLSDDGSVDWADASITQNTRGSYPIEFIDNAKVPCVAGHPTDVIFLTADAFGVLPPVSRLTPEQAMYHFISGYTAKVAGTEVGRDRSGGDVLALLRRAVSGVASGKIRGAAGGPDARTRRERVALEHGVERRAVRRRFADRPAVHAPPWWTRFTRASWWTRRPSRAGCSASTS